MVTILSLIRNRRVSIRKAIVVLRIVFGNITELTIPIYAAFAFIIVISGFVPYQVNAQSSKDIFGQIDTFVQGEMKRAAIPGLAYGIVYRDQVVHMQAFGKADANGRPVSPQTPFVIGSVAKTFTALAIRQLVNEKLVDLDAPVQRYIPWFRLADPQASAEISIRQLISHTSGLSTADGNKSRFFDEDVSIEELVRGMNDIRINNPVGSVQEYSNLNYLVLGEVVQLVTGVPFDEYVRTNIFTPLEMNNSYFDEAKAIQAGLATGFHTWYGFPIPMNANFPEGAASHGYVISSVEDMTHYLVAYLNQGSYKGKSVLLPVSSLFTSKPANYYDIHWNEYFRVHDRYIESQSGGTLNFNSVVQIMGENSQGTYGIVLLMNTRPDYVANVINSESIVNGITTLLRTEQTPMVTPFLSVKWYVVWGFVDLGLIGLIALAFIEVFSLFKKVSSKNFGTYSSQKGYIVMVSLDLLAGVFALVALPLWQNRPWQDLIKPFCELAPILIGTGSLLLIVVCIKIYMRIKAKSVRTT